jgi:trk system potassium uptake protein TrkH
MFAQLWMLFLGSFAACSGSTGGGIKMIRAMILYKQVYRELMLAMHPRAVYPARVAGAPVTPEDHRRRDGLRLSSTWSAFLSLTLLMSASGLDILTGFSAVVATINNTGPGSTWSGRLPPSAC